MFTNRQFLILGVLVAIAVCIFGCFGLALIGYLAREQQTVITRQDPTASDVRTEAIVQDTATAIPTVQDSAEEQEPTTTPEQPTATLNPPTDTPLPEPATPTLPPAATQTLPPVEANIIIVTVDKEDEFVIIQNVGPSPVDLTGWRLLSEKGPQNCDLNGVIQPNDTLQIWALAARIDQGGYNCGFDANIWNNSETDPAVLFDQNGIEVYRIDCKTKVCP